MSTIDNAFNKISRINFVPNSMVGRANEDLPLPIGHSQTISQPTTVRMMMEWLDPQSGDKVLDIGSGSGWTTALLAYITGPRGMVYAVEKVPELVKFGQQNCQNIGIKNVKFFQSSKKLGLSKYAPYDRILVSAAAQIFPVELLTQLKNQGKLVIPVNNDILEVTKTSDSNCEIIDHSGFVFVPLI